MMAAPIAAKLMTSAMICRCFEPRSRLNASPALTPFSSFAERDRIRLDPLAPDDRHDERGAQEHGGGADQQQVRRSDLRRVRRQRRAGDAAERRAAADEPEQPLRLPRVVDEVGDRPELADEQDAEDQPGQVERRPRPTSPGLEQEPEADQHARHAHLDDRQRPSAGAAARSATRSPVIRTPMMKPAASRTYGRLSAPRSGDELRPRDRLDDVVGRHREERVGEHHERGEALLLPHFDEGAKDALQSMAQA